MAPPRKSVSRGNGDLENDPERENRTQARAANPVVEDPEVNNSTQARAPNPLAKQKIRAKDPEQNNKTQARAKAPPVSEDEGSYRTGQNYQAAEDEEEGLAGDMSLDGDGLEALDPELGSRTKALPALETETPAGGGSDEEEGADDENATRAGPPLKLEIIAGPDAGKKKKFKGVRMVIGRTPGVDLLLTDQSVSRRHVELIYGDDGVLMKDCGSGNGTKVNGVKVAEKMLEHGDEIAIGKTRIRFVDELAAFKKAREENEKKEEEKKAAAAEKKASGEKKAVSAAEGEEAAAEGEAAEGEELAKPEKKPGGRVRPVRTSRSAGGDGGFAAKFKALPPPMRYGIVALVAVVLLILIGGIALRPPPPAPVDPAKAIADSKMQDARNAARDGDYERVVSLVNEAEKLQPGIDKTRLAAQAKEELTFMNGLEAAKKAIEEKRFEDAKKALEKTGKGSVKSEEAKLKVSAALDDAEIAYKLEKIDEFIAAGEVEAAKDLVRGLPVEKQGPPAEAIAAFERQLEEQKLLDAKDSAAAARNAAAAAKARREQDMNEAMVVVERKFGGGEWDRAASECARVMDSFANDKEIYQRAKKLQGLLPNFGRNYDEGMKKFRQGSLAQAAKPLRVAYGLYGQMNLRANKYGQELEDKIGAAAIVAGKEALLRDDLVTAWQMFKDASKFDPNDAKARAGLDDVQGKADDLFQSAYMIKDRDPRDAIRKFKIVVQVTDAGSTVHEKAKNQLAAMAP
ncbi:MAG: FHA domain-containing protein [Archangium sp.]|nr:FHA domain-containing protein [Archangium sp.]MDP3571664.1 FHA domain-containing protein [Archangium sp.]